MAPLVLLVLLAPQVLLDLRALRAPLALLVHLHFGHLEFDFLISIPLVLSLGGHDGGDDVSF